MVRSGIPLGGCLEVHIEANSLANLDVFSLSDPFAVLEMFLEGEWQELGRTETVWDELNPKWVRSFTLSPSIRTNARLRVTVYDRDGRSRNIAQQNKIGSAMCELSELLHYGPNGCRLPFIETKRGSVTLIGEMFAHDDEMHDLVLGRCKFRNASLFGKLANARAYLTIYRRRANQTWAPIYRSTVRRADPDALAESGPLRNACIRDVDTPLRLELRVHRATQEHTLIGAVELSLATLRDLTPGNKIVLDKNGGGGGELVITHATLEETSSNFDVLVSFRSK